jgi:HK97 family phage portal protein
VNTFQRVVARLLFGKKAIGFPVWQGSTQDYPPGGWGRLDWTDSGQTSAIQLATVYGCCRVLCGTTGSVPWNVYREDKSGTRTKATDHWLYPLLHDSPNAYMTSMEFREAMIMNFCLRGNAYAEKVLLGKRVVSLNPLRADMITPKLVGGQLVYEFHGLQGQTKTYQPEQIIHLKNFSMDGLVGLSPIRENAMRNAHYTENFGANFMRNQGRPSGVLQSKKPKPKDPDYNDRLSKDWQKLYGGENAGSTAVLWDEMEYKQISISPEDAQYLETRKLNSSSIAGEIFGVPLNMLGHTDKTATYASAEQFDIQFVKHTVRPLFVRIEQVFNKGLLSTEPGVFCEMDLDALQRGDSKTQAEYFATLTNHGIMKRNEARRKLNLPEVSYADMLTIQANMVDLDKLADLSEAATPGLAQADIRKTGATSDPAKALENHLHVGMPMSDEQITRIIKAITVSASTRSRKVRLIRGKDGATLGAEIAETPMEEEQIARAAKEIAVNAANEIMRAQPPAKLQRVRLVREADGTATGAEITED